MSKKSKQETITAIQKADALECDVEKIIKNSSDATKKLAFSKFIKKASDYIDDERDVLLIAIKIR